MSEQRAVVIGAGLGGLLSAALLCKHGRRVTVTEKLSFIGGKFTQFDYQGFAVPTGAFHTLPGGVNGPVMRALGALGLSAEALPLSMVLYTEKRGRLHPMYPHLRPNMRRRDSLFWAFGLRDLIGLGRMGRELKAGQNGPGGTLAENLRRFGISRRAERILSKMMEFSSAVPSDEADFLDFADCVRAHVGATPCVLTGGCRSIIDALESYIRGHGGEIITRARAARIAVEDGVVRGVGLADGRFLEAQIVTSSAGPQVTSRCLGPDCPGALAAKAAPAPAWGAAHSLRATEPFLRHDSIELPYDLERIGGYIEINRLAPRLAPPGWSYLLAYQHLRPDRDVPTQLRAGTAELMERFTGLRGLEEFNIATYRKGWPGARMQARHGQSGADRLPLQVDGIRGLYMLSDDNRAKGLAAEIIGSTALRFDELLEGM